MAWMKGLAAALLLLTLGLAAAIALGEARWRRLTQERLAQLGAAQPEAPVTRFDPAELDGLPPPVQRYLRAVLPVGAPRVRRVTLVHSGHFNLSEEGSNWKPFDSDQQVRTERPGFVWNARIRLLPWPSWPAVRVHDAYLDGEGVLHATLQGLLPLAELRGGAALAEGELMRYLAEAAWYPSALLPSPNLRWQALDAHSARVTLRDGALSVSLDVHFSAADGLIERVHAAARGRSLGGRIVPTPWQGRWSDYRRLQGVLVPTRGEVAWLTPQGAQPYWRGAVKALRYDDG